LDEIDRVGAERRNVPATDSFDPEYRRLRYCRYADDFVIGVIGSKADARQIMDDVRVFLATHLKLTVSEQKSSLNHASDGARFLGYDICTRSNPQNQRADFGGRRTTRRGSKDRLQLHVPREKVVDFVQGKGWGNYDASKPARRTAMLYASDVEIAVAFNAELRGFANYYALANDVKRKLNKAEYLAFGSFLCTLANKHKSSTTKIARRLRRGQDYYVGYEVHGKPRAIRLWKLKDLKKEARTFGTIDLAPQAGLVFDNTELVERLNARECERCGSTDKPCEVHHVRRLGDMRHADLPNRMRAARLRKRVVLCVDCHEHAHEFRPYMRRSASM
jgi:RNA-directed DNA polymerase